MNESTAILLMMNNYLHDVATALLVAGGFVMWLLWRLQAPEAGPESLRYFVRLYHGMTKLAWFAFIWIIAGGVPRIIFYKEFEWSNMAGRGQVPALIVKHILAFTLVAAGMLLWRKVRTKVREIEAQEASVEQP
jgi:hypothetical protein